jgi:hypothetical protein
MNSINSLSTGLASILLIPEGARIFAIMYHAAAPQLLQAKIIVCFK